jgi:hypothetical protein
MPQIEAELYVRANGRRIGQEELLADPVLRAQAGVGDNPLGGLYLSDGTFDVRLDDAFDFIANAFLYDAPATLAAGNDYGYDMRLSQGSIGVALSDGMATVIDDNSDRLTCPLPDLLAALASARAAYEQLVPRPTGAG